MKVAMLTPLLPTRTGVAHYASMILPALQERMSVTAFDSCGAGFNRRDFDAVIYQLGNNPYHEFAYREALLNPGIAVLHDVVLHHLIVEMTLARGDVDGYIDALRRNHGEAGAAWARGRAAGLHSEMGNFLFPASIEVANLSRAVIVHNEYAADRLRSFGVATPIHVVGHPYEPQRIAADRHEGRVIGLFGFLTSAKRAEIVIEAFRRACRRDRNLRLLIVGEPAPNIDMTALRGEGVTITGYVPDEEFAQYYGKVDRLVNLRYPTAGETSGTLIRAFDAGKPVAVSNYAQFAELPDTCVTKIPLGEGEVEALEEFFLEDIDEIAVAKAQRDWLDKHARIEQTINGYLTALSGAPATSPGLLTAPGIQLFPTLELLGANRSNERVTIRVKNGGASKIRAREYGTPRYRMIAKLFAGSEQTDDRWLDLPGDIEAGQEKTIDFIARGDTLRLYHALESIPLLEAEPWATAELERV